MEPNRFDQLTKTLASSTSRRQALKALAVATTGGILGWRATGTAGAASNSACAHWCAAVFGAGTAAAGQCTSDAAHGKGLCYSCGPGSPGGGVAPAAICCPHTSSGYCASYTGAACCPAGQTCSNGTCVTPTTTTPAPAQFEPRCTCGNGTVFTGGATCTDEQTCLGNAAASVCPNLCTGFGGVKSTTCVSCG